VENKHLHAVLLPDRAKEAPNSLKMTTRLHWCSKLM